MYKLDEIMGIDQDYFGIISIGSPNVILKSRNTGHIWCIQDRELIYGKIRSIVVYHKHREEKEFHIQKGFHPVNLSQAQDLIKEHDKWCIENRRKGK